MNSLGRSTSPTAKELEFINRWTRDYGFSTDIILEACERSSLATDKHRFEYAEGILNSWRQANVFLFPQQKDCQALFFRFLQPLYTFYPEQLRFRRSGKGNFK